MNVYIPSENITDMRGPAPSGFHVPLSTEWQAIYDAYTGLGLSGGTNFSTYLKMPMAGNRGNDKTVSNVGSYGYYWSSSPSDDGYRSKVIYFYSSSIYPQSNYYRSYGRSVRCLKNSPAVPTSSWTTLYQGSGSAGIFHNATDGLISISSDGTTWYTLMDKNLGATTVYNYGDTLTDANCGNVFQWGNNYAFPGTLSSDSITSSSTQVDASTYGPGNYYSSSTWITAQTWDNSNNGNLRGGETGPFKMNELKNAYIGEVYEYSYDFRNKSATILANDGWTNASSYTPTFSSHGIAGRSIRYTKPIDLSKASRLTLSSTGTGGADDEYGFRVGQTVTTSTRAGLTGANYTYNQIYMSLFSTSSTYFSGVSSGYHKIDFILDFNTKTFQIKLDGSSFQNGTVTDSQILDIKNNTTVLFAYVSGGGGDYYLETVSLILEK